MFSRIQLKVPQFIIKHKKGLASKDLGKLLIFTAFSSLREQFTNTKFFTFLRINILIALFSKGRNPTHPRLLQSTVKQIEISRIQCEQPGSINAYTQKP